AERPEDAGSSLDARRDGSQDADSPKRTSKPASSSPLGERRAATRIAGSIRHRDTRPAGFRTTYFGSEGAAAKRAPADAARLEANPRRRGRVLGRLGPRRHRPVRQGRARRVERKELAE